MLIVTGVKGAIFVGRLCWELAYLPFVWAGVPHKRRPEPRPANIQIISTSPQRRRRQKKTHRRCAA